MGKMREKRNDVPKKITVGLSVKAGVNSYELLAPNFILRPLGQNTLSQILLISTGQHLGDFLK